MGSDVGLRTPHLDSATAKARRHLAAARAARDGISTMVDALRISRPPRAPSKPPAIPSSVTVARRHALIPLAEGRPELEARIHALEDVVAARDAELLALKREWGRGLVRRNYVQKDRDAARADASAMRDIARASSATAHATRKRFVQFVEDVAAPLPSLRDVLAREASESAISAPLKEEITAALDDIEEVLSTARDSLERHPVPPTLPEQLQKENTSTPALTRAPLKSRNSGFPPSAAGSDDDSKSCASFASSSFFGEHRETQLDALVELVDILESKVSAGPAYPSANDAIHRARRTISSSRVKLPCEISDLVAERDLLRAQLDAVMSEKETVGGEDAAMALAAKAEAELRDANEEIATLRIRLTSFEKIAERAVKQEELASKNVLLANELRGARKTIERLIQEKGGLRRTALSSGLLSNTPTSAKLPPKGSADAMRRILDWRQRASSENQDTSANTGRALFREGEQGLSDDPSPAVAACLSKSEALPDRPTGLMLSRGPVKKRRMGASDSETSRTNEDNSLSERSLDVAVNDSISAQSLPVRGFLRRRDSFLSTGNVSASGEEITITNHRNIFSTGGPTLDGLKGLLG